MHETQPVLSVPSVCPKRSEAAQGRRPPFLRALRFLRDIPAAKQRKAGKATQFRSHNASNTALLALEPID